MPGAAISVGPETFTLEDLGAIRRVLDSADFKEVLRCVRGIRESFLDEMQNDVRVTPDGLRLIQGRVNGVADVIGGLVVAANHYTSAMLAAEQAEADQPKPGEETP